jgi:anti-sigma factor RsiW
MECSEYVAVSSEFRDGRTGRELSKEIEVHLSVCPRCRRHQHALEKGVGLLRTLPDLEVPEDFRARLVHRIYHIEDGASIARETLGSGATTLSVLAVALLLAAVAWTPRTGVGRPSIELPPVVVAAPPPPSSFTPPSRRSTFPRGPSVFTASGFLDGPWGDTHRVLFEYSSLSERRRSAVLSRVGIQ